MEAIVSFAAPLMYILGTTASLVFLTKRSFGKCLPLAMMLGAFLLFVSQLVFSTFTVGFVVGIIFAVASVGLGFWRRKVWAEYKKLLFSSGFIVFLVIYVGVYIYDFARGFAVWDEFSHWGMMLKEMMRLDKFYSVDVSNLMVHKDYPPIMQLFELLWMKLSGGYVEAYAERALHTFELSLVVPFVAEKIAEKKNIWKSALVGVAVTIGLAAIMILFDEHAVFHTIYNDYVMAVVVAYLVGIIMTSKEISWFEMVTVGLGGSFLVLLKQMGLPLYLMVACGLIGIMIMRNRKKLKEFLRRIGWRKIVGAMLLLAMPLVCYVIWGRVTQDVPKQFDLANLGIMDFIRVLRGHGEDWQIITRDNYLRSIWSENISTSFMLFSYVQGIVVFLGLGLLLYRCFKKQIPKGEMLFMLGLLVVGGVGYGVAMLLLYTMAFGSYEGPILASFERYMGTYLIVLGATLWFIMLKYGLTAKKMKWVIACAGVLVIMIIPAIGVRTRPRIHNNSAEVYAKYVEDTNYLRQVINEDEPKVFLVAQNTLGYHYYLQYFANPMKFNSMLFTWPTDDNVNGKLYYESTLLPELREYDYVYFAETDDAFNAKYCKVMNVCPNKNAKLYRVKVDEAKVSFEKV